MVRGEPHEANERRVTCALAPRNAHVRMRVGLKAARRTTRYGRLQTAANRGCFRRSRPRCARTRQRARRDRNPGTRRTRDSRVSRRRRRERRRWAGPSRPRSHCAFIRRLGRRHFGIDLRTPSPATAPDQHARQREPKGFVPPHHAGIVREMDAAVSVRQAHLELHTGPLGPDRRTTRLQPVPSGNQATGADRARRTHTGTRWSPTPRIAHQTGVCRLLASSIRFINCTRKAMSLNVVENALATARAAQR
jgi:hypothetical protein